MCFLRCSRQLCSVLRLKSPGMQKSKNITRRIFSPLLCSRREVAAQNSPESLPPVRHRELRNPPSQHLSPWQQRLKEEMARVTQEDEALPAGRQAPLPPPPPPPPPRPPSSTSYTYFHSLPINPLYICPYRSPNRHHSLSFTLSFTPLTLALCHLPRLPPFHFPPFTFSSGLFLRHSSLSVAAETLRCCCCCTAEQIFFSFFKKERSDFLQ